MTYLIMKKVKFLFDLNGQYFIDFRVCCNLLLAFYQVLSYFLITVSWSISAAKKLPEK